MKKLVQALVLLLLSASFCIASERDSNKWNDFEGTMGSANIQLSLYRFENGQIKGNYYYKKYGTKIYLSGKIVDNKIELTEFLDGKPNGTFKGTVFTDKKDRFEGTWVKNSSSQPVEFKLVLISICGGTYEHRYSSFDGTDEALEAFMLKVKNSILKGDKNWIASHTRYPIKAVLNHGKLIAIKTGPQLIDNFNQIFNPEYKEKLTPLRTYNLFNNYQGIMLGNGQIWINNTPKSTESTPDYQIITINN